MGELKIFNTLTGKKEVFVPADAPKIGIYVCGMTVYDYCHIGHGRMMVAFDAIVRFLRAQNYQVHYVRNITDVDDKIIAKAKHENITMTSLSEKFTLALAEDEEALDILPPDQSPKATNYISQMQELISGLIDQGYAYEVPKGGVYYEVAKFNQYGKLSGRSQQAFYEHGRIEADLNKHSLADFCLWKCQAAEEPGWDSPWGWGRPGWHIECSTMSMSCLGESFDIHGGGADLIFPHHENEIAQSEGYTGKPYAKYWMHVGHVRMDDQKMSKSLGNFFTIRDVLRQFPAEVVRYFLLSSHYRSPLNYSVSALQAASNAVRTLYLALRGVTPMALATAQKQQDIDAAETLINEAKARFNNAMYDDFNTVEALAVLMWLAHKINLYTDKNTLVIRYIAHCLYALGNQLGLLKLTPDEFLQSTTANQATSNSALSDEAIEQLIEKRVIARQQNDYAAADEIRQQLVAQGIILEDSRDATLWRRASEKTDVES